MGQLDFGVHNNSFNYPPPTENLSIIKKIVEAYKLWHSYVKNLPKTSHYSLGGKIEGLFTDLIESTYTAGYLPKLEKLPFIGKSINKLNLLNFFLQIAWELKAIDNNKYQNISLQLNEIGRILGGWRNKIKTETSARK